MIKRNTRRIRRKSNARRKNQKGGIKKLSQGLKWVRGAPAAAVAGIRGVYAEAPKKKMRAAVTPVRPYAMTRSGPIYSGEGGKKRTKRRTKKRRTKKRSTKKRRTKKRRQRGGRANVNWHEGSPLSYYGYPKNVTYDAGGTPNGIWGPTQY